MKQAFTLIELLVVVLIIGVLTAVALPVYEGAVDQTHWSTMLPGAKAIKHAEESIRMSRGLYSADIEHLKVTMNNNANLQIQIQTINNGDEANVIRVTNPKLANVRLASYLDVNPVMGGQLHCEAKSGDERANRLCENLLMGEELKTTSDGYIAYLLEQGIDQATCDNVGRSWSSSKTKCYKTTADRCSALGMGVVAGMADQCGYRNGTSGKNVGAEGICIGDTGNYACGNVTYSNGGTCVAQGNAWVACYGAIINEGGVCDSRQSKGEGCRSAQINNGGECLGACVRAIINEGGVCKGACLQSTYNGGICIGSEADSCASGKYTNGAICYALNSKACRVENHHYDWDVSGQYDSTSCCCGNYCPSTAPKCAPSRCDPQYMK